jgi:RecJ-like exonuclease
MKILPKKPEYISGLLSRFTTKEKSMFDDVLKQLKEFEEHDELMDTVARITKKTYDALIRAGFTDEQATIIVAGQGTGLGKSSS